MQSLSPLLDSALQPDASKELGRLNYFADLTQPEDLVVSFRNAIVAYKTLQLEKDANILFGKAHLSLPTHMASGQDALLNFLKLYPPGLMRSLVPMEEYLYTSVQVYTDEAGVIQQERIIHEKLREVFGTR